MRTITRATFTTIKTEGGILPADLLQRIAEGRDLDGLKPEDYHLYAGERLNEAINRAWNRCLGAWQAFDTQRVALPDSDRGTTLTRERWLLILFQELGYGRVPFVGSLPVHRDDPESLKYPISHLWGQAPLHFVSFRYDLDRRPPTADNRQRKDDGGLSSSTGSRSPHSLMQEFLNRSEDYLWGLVSNGLRLRVLRDNVSLTRAAFVEFDLEALFTGEHYADFVVLWLLCHQSRVEVPPVSPPVGGDGGGACWLERWSQLAAEQGVRALDALRDGVQEAIAALGRGFLAHRANDRLRARLKSGDLSTQDYYRQLLRMVYRLIFLLVAEERELLLVRTTDDGRPTPGCRQSAVSSQLYHRYYAVSRLRDMAATLRGGPHADLYRSLRLLFGLLATGYPPLGLPALGSFLFSNKEKQRATPDLDDAELANAELLAAIRALTWTTEGNVLRPVDYRNLGAEELGSVYESLLELHPQLNVDAALFTLDTAAGSERKTTGSYYTPTSLIQSLLDTALEPVIRDRLTADGRRTTDDPSLHSGQAPGDQQSAVGGPPPSGGPQSAVGGPSPESALLSIKVIDPACGSGHFLIAAAHRLAHHLARIRTGDEEPAPAELRAALRDVVRRCIHGVDINPMAVELCKVALWMETLDPGKPLSFLDHNLQCGNSLFGATPALLRRGIPDAAFQPLTGDDKEECQEARKKNREERRGQLSLFQPDLQPWEQLGNLAAGMLELDAGPEETLDDVHHKEDLYTRLVTSSGYRFGRLLADAWCAAFVWPKDKETPYALTEATFRQIEHNPYTLPQWMGETITALKERYAFFHWHLAFPGVFTPSPPAPENEDSEEATGWDGGFDVVLGNPPWERIKLQEKEFFAQYAPEIAEARKAADRKQLIKALPKTDPALHRQYLDALRDSEAQSHFLRNSGRYPLSAVGDINTYQVFAGLTRQLRNERGRVGVVLPTGIATDYFNRDYFGALVEGRELVSLYDFENRAGLFPDVDSRMKFCLLTLTGPEMPVDAAEFAFFLHQPEQLRDPERRFTLTPADFRRINPNTRTCPIFRTRRDAELTRAIYARVPVLINEARDANPWGISFLRMFDMSNDSHLFRTREQLEAQGFTLHGNHFTRRNDTYLPLYEAKMFWHFDHRFGTYAGITDRSDTHLESPTLRNHSDIDFLTTPWYWVDQDECHKRLPPEPEWLLAFRDITNSTNERTSVFTVIPYVAVGHTAPLMLFDKVETSQVCLLLANLDSLSFDFFVRQKMGGTHLTYFVLRQLPVLPPSTYDKPCPWLSPVSGPPSSVSGPPSPVSGPPSPVSGPPSPVSGPPSPDTYAAFLLPRVLELTYTAWDLKPFAEDCGYDGPPFVWDEERRFLLRCELDAAYFHLYGIAREDVDYIMETFPIVKRKDEAAYGEYRTKRVIMEMYDEMAGEKATADGRPTTAGERQQEGGGGQRSVVGGRPYQTHLDPPPADPRVAHQGEPPEYLVKLWASWRAQQAESNAVAERAPVQPRLAPKPAAPPTATPATGAQIWGAGLTPIGRLARIAELQHEGTRKAIGELTVALTAETRSVRSRASSALRTLGGAHVVDFVAAFLKYRVPDTALLEAINILVQLGDASAIPALEKLAARRDVGEEVRRAAREAVGKMKGN